MLLLEQQQQQVGVLAMVPPRNAFGPLLPTIVGVGAQDEQVAGYGVDVSRVFFEQWMLPQNAVLCLARSRGEGRHPVQPGKRLDLSQLKPKRTRPLLTMQTSLSSVSSAYGSELGNLCLDDSQNVRLRTANPLDLIHFTEAMGV